VGEQLRRILQLSPLYPLPVLRRRILHLSCHHAHASRL
jgi:hypothetical protein